MKKIALVTGAGSGIGLATVNILSRSGYIVIATSILSEELAQLALINFDNVEIRQLDVTNQSAVDDVVKAVQDTYGQLDVLINCAGTWLPSLVESVTAADIEFQIQLNAIAPIRLIQSFMPLLEAAEGYAITVSSMNGKVSMAGSGAYSASKFALEALISALRLEIGKRKVKLVNIQPGQIRTNLFQKAKQHYDCLVHEYPESYKNANVDNIAGIYNAIARGSRSKNTPEKVACLIIRILCTHRPRSTYSVGLDARILIFINQYFPERLRQWILRELNSRFIPTLGKYFY
ncbi:putative oxidoreductase [Marinomonas spartinae]|uniref:SDR family NAD(P)-dependent oxidoreductase n=1 Tax=Marinomonas spartinae TaxID=1792290 RepID=UPI000808DBC7|nr:SDR family NAD(P)-dependent oxidoreductase [Marinomonas spartinae]SBS27168.1 putative oxidoreductase [Marinomonas spartinae]